MTCFKEHLPIWQDTVSFRKWPRLEGVASCDVLVIGGGMAGILTADRLHKQGVDVIIAESCRVGAGVTAGTTAKITSQHGLIYQKLIKSMGVENAGRYLEAGEKALLEYVKLAEQYPCDLERKSSFVYSRRGAGCLEKEMRALETLNYRAELRDGAWVSNHLPLNTDGAVEFPLQAQFNPLKLLKGLTETEEGKGLRIYENTRVLKLKRWKDGGWEAVTEHGMILADQIVMASHFPVYNRRGLYFLKMYQSRSWAIAGCSRAGESGEKNQKPQLGGMYVDEDEKGLSFREYGGLTILAGGSGRPGSREQTKGWDDLEDLAEQCYPGWKSRYRWAAQDCMTLDGVPYIGPYYESASAAKASGIWVAAGFNKWGMTGSMTAAMVLSEEIAGRKSLYSEIFNPSRSMMRKQLFLNGAESMMNLIRPTAPRCRHLGCALKWNPSERTWDCSCHGSRYDEEGCCIEGPSKKNLNFRK